MHVRVPKPLHGWRAFGGEALIIVLGVLIALGFGKLVEQWQWRQGVETTRRSTMRLRRQRGAIDADPPRPGSFGSGARIGSPGR